MHKAFFIFFNTSHCQKCFQILRDERREDATENPKTTKSTFSKEALAKAHLFKENAGSLSVLFSWGAFCSANSSASVCPGLCACLGGLQGVLCSLCFWLLRSRCLFYYLNNCLFAIETFETLLVRHGSL